MVIFLNDFAQECFLDSYALAFKEQWWEWFASWWVFQVWDPFHPKNYNKLRSVSLTLAFTADINFIHVFLCF